MLRYAMTALLVPDYDEAIAYFTETLGFELLEDTALDERKRWVVVSPSRSGAAILLARAASPQQRERVGDQAGGRVAFFLHSDDFTTDHARLVAAGVAFVEAPRVELYGRVAVFLDAFGNRWDLVERREDRHEEGRSW